MWGLITKTHNYTEHYSANKRALKAIQNTLRTYEWALQDIGGMIKEIGVNAGRYSSYTEIADIGAKELIAGFLNIPKVITQEYKILDFGFLRREISDKIAQTLPSSLIKTLTRTIENPDLTAVYRVWEDYAQKALIKV